MAPLDKPLEKKQQALTAFFTPRTAQSQLVPASERSDIVSSPDSPTRKRPLGRVADEANGSLEQCRKRSKIDHTSAQAEKSAYFPRSNGVETTPTDKPPSSSPTARAERFLHVASGPNKNANETENEETGEDAETKRQNEELHKKFVKKLGHPDAFSWRSRCSTRDAVADVEDAEGDDDDDEGQTQAAVKKKGGKTGKLTPMEQQFLEIKRQHLDTVLIVEVGYKFRFFGEDARIAAKELSIVCIPGKLRYDEHPSEAHLDRFASASIPVHRLPVHAKRLVAAGHKVGVVRQIETAALKKAGDNRNTPFVRKLTNLYTKGTYVDENGELDKQAEGASAGGYLLCITETKSNGWGTDEKVDVGILAVQPATGDIIYDDFEDGFMRSEIETRLLHISPCEFLIVGELTMATEKLVQRLSGSSTNVFGERSRVERVPKSQTAAAEAYAQVTQFYAAKVKDAASNDTAAALLDKVLKLPEPVTVCLAAMIGHLQEYGLEHIFDLTKYFQSFSTRSHMLISGTTLESLEVYRNATDHAEKGSLFWALDKTLTRFGKRLLRKWVGRPLLSREPLEDRLAAVQELLDKQTSLPVDELKNLLSSIKVDLERSLIRIYYGKCTRPELLLVLQTLHKVALYYARLAESSAMPFSAGLLTSAITTLPQILDSVVSYLGRINLQAARQDDKYRFFRDEHQTEDVHDHQLSIAHVEHELDAHRAVAAKLVGRKQVEYVTVAGIEYLIEVPNNDVRHVPASWAKISGTKKLSRFHTPEVLRLTGERDQHREALSAACDKAFRDLLSEIAADYQPLRDAIAALATLDCLLSLSRVAAQPGYSKPTILPASSEPTISVVQARHPVAEQTLEAAYIPFSTTLAQPRPLAHLITGPNMGGKSSFVRALALVVLLAQIGSFVPADELSLTLCDTIQTRAGARDNLFAGESTFMIELSETARILRAATPRSLVILDELGRGTSTHDGAAIAEAVLHYAVTESRCLTLFITHYQSLARACSNLAAVSNLHMKFEAHTAADGREDITFLYEVAPGMAHRSYGLNVARLARIPDKVLDMAANRSRQLELRMRTRQILGACHGLKRLWSNGGLDQLQHAVMMIEQL